MWRAKTKILIVLWAFLRVDILIQILLFVDVVSRNNINWEIIFSSVVFSTFFYEAALLKIIILNFWLVFKKWKLISNKYIEKTIFECMFEVHLRGKDLDERMELKCSVYLTSSVSKDTTSVGKFKFPKSKGKKLK